MSSWGVLGTGDWWINLTVRCVKMFAQATGGALLTGAAKVVSVPWLTAVEIGATATALCVLTSLGSIPVPDAPTLLRSLVRRAPTLLRSLVRRG